MLQSMGLQRVGHDLATQQQKLLGVLCQISVSVLLLKKYISFAKHSPILIYFALAQITPLSNFISKKE